MAAPSGPRASFVQRFFAALLDGILFFIFSEVLRAIVGQSFAGILSLALGIAYWSYFEGSSSGQTIGKRVIGIRVIDLQGGGPIGFSRAVIRYFSRILSTIPLLLGYFWMLWDPEKQTWHDKLAGSVVVPVADFPVERWPG